MNITGGLIKDMSEAVGTSIRLIFVKIDRAIFEFYSQVLKLFFDMTRTKFFTGGIFTAIFRRIFLILGIFMVFKLTISFLRYLISPDAMNDKEKGVGKVIGRTITCILFLFVLMPGAAKQKNGGLNVNNTTGDFRDNINEQGILFGILQSAENAILDGDVIPRLILGKVPSNIASQASEETATTVFGAFFRINKEVLTQTDDENYVCISEESGESVASLLADEVDENKPLASFDDVEEFVNVRCVNGGKTEYMFIYSIFISTLIGLALVVLTFLFTFDVAIRMIKLGLLRIISPIPAISYISPKSAKDGAFAAYTSALIKTYLDLFLRIATIYLILYLAIFISDPNTSWMGNQSRNPVAFIIALIALFFFALQAPKFIKQALGIKETGIGLGFGAALIGGALAGGVTGFATGGVWGGLRGIFGGANAGAQNQWAAQNGQKPNISARQAALNRGAQIGSGDPNAKGRGLMSNLGGMLGNAVAGTTNSRINRGKQNVKTAQSDSATAAQIKDVFEHGGNVGDLTKAQSDWMIRHNDLIAYDHNGNVNWTKTNATLAEYAEKRKNDAESMSGDLDDAKKENKSRKDSGMRRKYRVTKRYK